MNWVFEYSHIQFVRSLGLLMLFFPLLFLSPSSMPPPPLFSLKNLISNAFQTILKIEWKWISDEDIFKGKFPRKKFMFSFVCFFFYRFQFNNNMSIFWINTSLVPVMFHFKFLMCYFSSEPSNSNAVLFIINCIYKIQLTSRRRKRRKTRIILASDSLNDFSTHFSLCHTQECAVQSSLRSINIWLYIMAIYFVLRGFNQWQKKVNS